jgi:hypothetical protein
VTIETLNAIKAEAVALQVGINNFGQTITNAELAGVEIPQDIDGAYTALSVNLGIIYTWVLQAIEGGTVEEQELTTMQAFLAELKAVFDKYAAVIEYMDGAGYGESYGGASFYRLTATDPVNGNVETKDIVSATLTSEQLV